MGSGPESKAGGTVKSQLGAAQTPKLPLGGVWEKVTVLPLTEALIDHVDGVGDGGGGAPIVTVPERPEASIEVIEIVTPFVGSEKLVPGLKAASIKSVQSFGSADVESGVESIK